MMTRIMTSILAYLWIAAVISKAGAEYKCISSDNEAVKLSISNRRNQTGHFISKVEFEYRDAPGVKETDLWRVDVEEKTESCEGLTTSHLTYTISAPAFSAPAFSAPAFPAPFRQHAVIAKPTVVAKPTVIDPPTGYELFPGIGYYKFHGEAVIWPHAKALCAEEGAHLVIINSEIESDVMRTLFARSPKITGASTHDWAWVGLREVEGVDGQYKTIFGVPLKDTGFTRWSPGEPGDRTTGDYIMVYKYSGGLADVHTKAGWKLAFICELEL